MTAVIDPAAESALWQQIEADPADESPKLIAAEWYADHGDVTMEAALRWCVRRGKWPFVTKERGAVWFNEGYYRMERECMLPDKFFTHPWNFKRLPTLPAALRWLGERLAAMEGE